MSELLKTVFFDKHIAANATMTDFGGWNMPLNYPRGILEEHLITRKNAGLFDVSHMGRFVIRGKNSLLFLQHVLTNNAAALDINQAQYTIIQNSNGGAIDDAYLYKFAPTEYILVVNAGNQLRVWEHLSHTAKRYSSAVEFEDRSIEIAMLSLQGPKSKTILSSLLEGGRIPDPVKNAMSSITIKGSKILIARTGYTGEPLGFELFIAREDALKVWDALIEKEAIPVGLGARDTLRLESGLPLYGHELGVDLEGKEIPIFAVPLSKFAVSFSPLKENFLGKEALLKQFEAQKKIIKKDYSAINDLPKHILPFAIIGRGIARQGFKVYKGEKAVGYVTSGTMIPYFKTTGEGLATGISEERGMRAIGLALLDSDISEGDNIQVDIRGVKADGIIVKWHLRTDAPPYARPILAEHTALVKPLSENTYKEKTENLLEKAFNNTVWRQKECINLIPSEQTHSPATRLLSVMDSSFRYAEHKKVRSFYDTEVFYYQGTDFIAEVENLLAAEFRKYLGCKNVETRTVSGQMANTAVFAAMLDFVNRDNRKAEPRRLKNVMNNHIIKGGHLSAQPMGALNNFIQIDPVTERPSVINFPTLPGNPYKIDANAAKRLIAENLPDLIIFGKSLVLHPEPVEEVKAFMQAQGIKSIVMYDMAHVLGLIGPYFQEPFKDGADIVTGSTHKTFFGSQRGIISSDFAEKDDNYKLWETIENRVFPGSVSNHHLGTLLGLLMSAYEMNNFKDEYQEKVIMNAKALAKALKDLGFEVAGDPAVSFTETHQIIVNVGYAKGPEVAKRLEENNIIVNYQATPEEEGFTASGALRLGSQEMTRFGLNEDDFKTVAQLIKDAFDGKSVKEEVKKFRENFLDLKFCFKEPELEEKIQRLHSLI
ncbi:MAG: glycine cleavage system protein T [Candidatus Firestonebacteria bacterium RIFOXYC2_FULL_39_67]|nr:MAG: glycine cleavage system protein T [Candidatus Firestonebacteria bacterium RIFOXYD2_FULL_39_29]OGF56883.1 MAG: glycine cleavage system protein T [Candidatus Firestonebacteria bacterium RIFOXYC2_FULL_39_67]OGF57766.1 MAG: glycine cleavage system protein T [Candidatus Firestonebacteria bacterium RifOxyC12_full_39_7]